MVSLMFCIMVILCTLRLQKKRCDFLFVSITEDKFIKKGLNRPIHDHFERVYFFKKTKYD